MVEESGTVEVRFYKKNCAFPPIGRDGSVGVGRRLIQGWGQRRMPLEYLYFAMQMENIQVPPPSRWFHLHYALSLRRLCLCFIDRPREIFLSLSHFPPPLAAILLFPVRFLPIFLAVCIGLGVFARITLTGNNDSAVVAAKRHRESFSNTCRG